jgi:hypothetical protein
MNRPPQLAASFISAWRRRKYAEQLMGFFRSHLDGLIVLKTLFLSASFEAVPSRG